jgi:putative effector of murein hydrolase LrgA (UPF0299 family)
MEIEWVVISICIVCNVAAYYFDLFYNWKKEDKHE